ncbi:MAG: hypothetical protein LC768_07660 [Acidobacteria bacterium]|nr:hypothetical protein [Acidobacteriota bacterium]
MNKESPQIKFNRKDVANELVNWIDKFKCKPCAVEFRFKHENSQRACWIATAEGKRVITDIISKLVIIEGGFTPITSALFKEAASKNLKEERSVHWLTGQNCDYSSSENNEHLLNSWNWETLSEGSDWQYSKWSHDEFEVKHVLEEAVEIHKQIIDSTCYTYLFAAIPAKAVRHTGEFTEIVVMQVIWSTPVDRDLQDQIRDAASHRMIWTTVRTTDKEARALEFVKESLQESGYLFRKSKTGSLLVKHDVSGWTPSEIQHHHESLKLVVDNFESAIRLLKNCESGSEHSLIGNCDSNVTCSHVWIAKALSRGAFRYCRVFPVYVMETAVLKLMGAQPLVQ